MTEPKRVLSDAGGGALRSIITGGHWSQMRLFKAGYADSDECQLCPGEPGTLVHKFLSQKARPPHLVAAPCQWVRRPSQQRRVGAGA